MGNLLSVNAGEVLKLKGEWHNHPKFGEQFKITSYESVVPATVKGIEKYLGSGLIKGIGPVMDKPFEVLSIPYEQQKLKLEFI